MRHSPLTCGLAVSLAGSTVLAVALGGGPQQVPDHSRSASRYSIRAVPLLDGFTYAGVNHVNTRGEAAGATSNRNGTRALAMDGREVGLLEDLGGTYHYASAINESGQIAGASQSQPWWGYKAVRWNTDGSMIVIAPLTNDEHDNCQAFGMNNLGQMVGQSDAAGGQWHAFLWDEQSGILDLGTLGGSYSAANDINDHGVVVGWSHGRVQVETPFIWRDGEMTALPTLGGAELPGGIAHAINNHGVIVGESNGEQYGIRRAVVWDAEGNIHDLGTFGGLSSRAYDVNDAGVIVGEARDESGAFRAFIYQNGEMRDLNNLLPAGSGWVLQHAFGISEDGRIVGSGRMTNGEYRGFILEPVRARSFSAK